MALKNNIFAVQRKPMKRSAPRATEQRMIEKGFLPPIDGGEFGQEQAEALEEVANYFDAGSEDLRGTNIPGSEDLYGTNVPGSEGLYGTNVPGIEPLYGTLYGTNVPGSGGDLGALYGTNVPGKKNVQGKGVRIKKCRPPKAAFDLSSVNKTEDLMLNFIMDVCLQRGEKSTYHIKSEVFCASIQRTHEALRKAASRMRKKGWILPIQDGDVINGHHGGTIYRLHENVWEFLFKLRGLPGTVVPGSEALYGTLYGTLPGTTSPPSSSSINNNKTTTTGTELLGCERLDLSPLIELGIKLSPEHFVPRVKEGRVTLDQIQESIYAFAFDLRFNGKGQHINGDVINYLMGILRRGPYVPPHNYKSPTALQQEAYLAWKREEAERQQKLDEQIIGLEFGAWWDGLSDLERNAYSPASVGANEASVGSPMHLHSVKVEVFMKTVWPRLREQLPPFQERQGATAKDEPSPRRDGSWLVGANEFEALLKNPPKGPFGT